MFCLIIVSQRLGQSRSETKIWTLSVSSFVCLSVSCLTTPAYRTTSGCISGYYIRLHFRLQFWVLLKSEKGIAMHSLCETSCALRTVHFITTPLFWQRWISVAIGQAIAEIEFLGKLSIIFASLLNLNFWVAGRSTIRCDVWLGIVVYQLKTQNLRSLAPIPKQRICFTFYL